MSNDFALGNPYNTAQYSLLLHMVAQCTNHTGEELIWVGGDVHLYNNQVAIFKEQLTRDTFKTIPTVKLNPDIKEIDDFTFDDIEIVNYESNDVLKYPDAAV